MRACRRAPGCRARRRCVTAVELRGRGALGGERAREVLLAGGEHVDAEALRPRGPRAACARPLSKQTSSEHRLQAQSDATALAVMPCGPSGASAVTTASRRWRKCPTTCAEAVGIGAPWRRRTDSSGEDCSEPGAGAQRAATRPAGAGHFRLAHGAAQRRPSRMLPPRMVRRRACSEPLPRFAAAAIVAACGRPRASQRIRRTRRCPTHVKHGAVLFVGALLGLPHAGRRRRRRARRAQHQATRERMDGPNFNSARRTTDAVLYAIRNGGFSGAIMPAEHRRRRGRRGRRGVPREVRGQGSKRPSRRSSSSSVAPAGAGRARPEADPARPRRGARRRWRARRRRRGARLDRRARARRALARAATAAPRTLRAEQNGRSTRRSRGQAARARTRRGDRRACSEARRPRSRSSPRRAAAAEAELQRGAAALPNLPDPTRGATRTPSLREVGEAARRTAAATTSSWPARVIDMERGARLSGLALRLPARRPRAARAGARALGARDAERRRASSRSSRRCSCARRRCTAPASCPTPSSRSTALPDDDAVPRRARARSRSRRCTPARSSTRTRCRCRYAGFSPCFRREAGAAGQGHARDLPRAPVRQGRDVQLRRAGDVGATSTSGCWRSRRRSCRSSRSPTASSTSRSTTSALGGQEVRLRGVAARPGPLPRADVDARTRPTSRRGGWTSATAPGRRPARRRAHAQRHGRRRRRARSSRCWRTASGRTAASRCRAVLAPTARRRRCRPPRSAAEVAADEQRAPRSVGHDVERRVQARDLEEPQHRRVCADDGHRARRRG